MVTNGFWPATPAGSAFTGDIRRSAIPERRARTINILNLNRVILPCRIICKYIDIYNIKSFSL
jgi:hypothetical protein